MRRGGPSDGAADAAETAIRAARPEEADALSALAFRSKAYWGYDGDFMEACRAELSISAEEIAGNPTYVLERGGAVVGFYSLERCSPDEVEIDLLFVEPVAIGRGHGRALLEHLLGEARRRGYRVVTIQSDPNAAAFYRACGARAVGWRPSASVPGRSLPLLEIALEPAG